METSLAIEASSPLPIKRPQSVAELGEAIVAARANREGVYPVGGRTMLDVGLPPLKPGVAIDTTALADVIDYPARDMTVTVRAGITIARLQEELAREGQWLPIDVAAPPRATLGGAIALNASGPRRYGFGTLRDYVIGISFVTDAGTEVKAGGRVVKNVAGYDLMKLQIGALGTLGIVTQATLKVKPRTEASAAVVFGCPGEALADLLDRLHASRSRPTVVELLNRAAWKLLPQAGPTNLEAPWRLAVGFAEKAATVRWQQATLLEELHAAGVRDAVEIADASALWSAIADFQVRPESPHISKASVLPSRLAAEALAVATRLPGALVHAHALNGILWIHSDEPAELEGAIVRRGPVEQKKSLRVWGALTSDWELMRQIKRTLDPDNVFNPGRLFGDL